MNIKSKSKPRKSTKNKSIKSKSIKNKSIKNKGKMITYTLDGKIKTTSGISHDGKDVFRKMTTDASELKLCKIIKDNPHPNIIAIYDIGADKDGVGYIDMELLKTVINKKDEDEIKKAMTKVKPYLHKLGIMYIDWKFDNIGKSDDGQFKLFDFNCSGLIDITSKDQKWILKPPPYWSYSKAVARLIDIKKANKKTKPVFDWFYRNLINERMLTPIEIDDYAFDIAFNNAPTDTPAPKQHHSNVYN
jgi:serine/threonine protein kinase